LGSVRARPWRGATRPPALLGALMHNADAGWRIGARHAPTCAVGNGSVSHRKKYGRRVSGALTTALRGPRSVRWVSGSLQHQRVSESRHQRVSECKRRHGARDYCPSDAMNASSSSSSRGAPPMRWQRPGATAAGAVLAVFQAAGFHARAARLAIGFVPATSLRHHGGQSARQLRLQALEVGLADGLSSVAGSGAATERV
jgi:hypothetical protein